MAYGHKTNSDCWEWNITEHKVVNGIAWGNRVWTEKIMTKILAVHLWLPRGTECMKRGSRKFTSKNGGARKHLRRAFKKRTLTVEKKLLSVLRYYENILRKLLENVWYWHSLLWLKPSCSLSHIRWFEVQTHCNEVSNSVLYQSFSLPLK